MEGGRGGGAALSEVGGVEDRKGGGLALSEAEGLEGWRVEGLEDGRIGGLALSEVGGLEVERVVHYSLFIITNFSFFIFHFETQAVIGEGLVGRIDGREALAGGWIVEADGQLAGLWIER